MKMVHRSMFWAILLLTFIMPACSKREEGKIRLAFVSNNPFGFWNYAEKGCQQAAQDFDVKVEFRKPAKGTSAEQTTIIEELMVTGLQGLAISPNDPENFIDFLKTVKARIPLAMADNDLPDPSVRNFYVGTHNYRAGRAAGALVKKAAPEGGKIVVFVGRMDVPNAIERRQGMLDYLAGKEQKEMTDRTPADATNLAVGKWTLVSTITDGGGGGGQTICQNKTEELLLRTPNLACLIGLWEYNPPAILKAVKDRSYKTAIVGFDENFDTLESIQKGDIVGTVVQNPYMFGYKSIKLLAGIARKDPDVFKGETMDANNCIHIPHRVIVKNPGNEKIGNSETVDVDVFYPEARRLRGE